MSFIGRWDITVGEGEAAYPSWVEISETDGRFVGKVGSARPVPIVEICGEALHFELPPQYEGYPNDLCFDGVLADGVITGTTNAKDGSLLPWTAKPAPEFVHIGMPIYGQSIDIIETPWHARWPEMENHWSVVDGDLVNSKQGTDLVTDASYSNFKLEAEYSYPVDSNSGIYLRGRYEVQVLDDYGKEPSVGSSAAIYGFLAPKVNSVKPFGERNIAEITLIGREVTLVLNGVTVHDHAEIPGITGGALESDEGAPGPILIQGDHGPVTYHRLVLTPITFG